MAIGKFWSQLMLFVAALLLILVTREYVSHQLIDNGVDSYQTHTILAIGVNLILIAISYYFIHKNGLWKIAGIKGTPLRKWYLLIFPLIYLVLLNAVFMDDIKGELLVSHLILLLVYCLSIGFAEELSIRGFLQSHLIKRFGNTKRKIVLSIFASALFFGVVHLMKFDKGIYGELSQVCFATFIGLMFGVLLVITKRIFPLIIIHAIIDFVAKLDSIGLPIKNKVTEPMSIENAVLIVLLTLPCLGYGIFLMKKYRLIDQNKLGHEG